MTLTHTKNSLVHLFLVFVGLSSLLTSTNLAVVVEAQRIERPNSTCGIYENVALAEDACQGRFLMWGQSYDKNNNNTFISVFEENYTANVGPFYCDNCGKNNPEFGYGYVGTDGISLPTLVSSGFTKGNKTGILNDGWDVCADKEKSIVAQNIPGDITCSALQKHCEKINAGWLIYAKSFKTAHGEFLCSGGCKKMMLLDNNDYQGYSRIWVPEGYTNLLSLPMIMMYSAMFTIFSISLFINYSTRDYDFTKFEWLTNFVLLTLGYLDIEGNRQTLKDQVFVNPVECFSCKCCCRDTIENRIKVFKAWLQFLSVFVLSLGVALLFGGGVIHEQVCLFNTLPILPNDATPEDLDYSKHFESLFLDGRFNIAYDTTDTQAHSTWFDAPWFVSEVIIVLFARSQGLLMHNLAKTKQMSETLVLFIMLVLSSFFSGLAAWYTWQDFTADQLIFEWFVGFLIAIVIVPVFVAISYAIAYVLVRCFCKNASFSSDGDNNQGEGSSNEQGENDDGIQEALYMGTLHQPAAAMSP